MSCGRGERPGGVPGEGPEPPSPPSSGRRAAEDAGRASSPMRGRMGTQGSPVKSYDYLLKFLLVGDSDVGKGEILESLQDGASESPYAYSNGKGGWGGGGRIGPVASRGEPAPQHPRPCNRQQAGTGARGRCPWGDQRWGGEGGGGGVVLLFFPSDFFFNFCMDWKRSAVCQGSRGWQQKGHGCCLKS